jgi:putative transposase
MDVNIKILQDSYKKESDPHIRERILMVVELKRGQSSRSVGRQFGCSHGKAIYWKNRFEKAGLQGLRTKPRSGKPRKLSDKDIAKIKETLEKNPYGWGSKSVREMIYKDHGIMYSFRHIVRLLHKWGFALIKPRKRHIAKDDNEVKTFKKMPEKLWDRSQRVGQQYAKTNQ